VLWERERDEGFVLDDQDACCGQRRIDARGLAVGLERHHDRLGRPDFEWALQRIEEPLLAELAVDRGAEVRCGRLQHGETEALAGWRRCPRSAELLPGESQLTG